MHLNNVDLPVPDGPIMEITSPLSTFKSTCFKTESSPKFFLSPSIVKIDCFYISDLPPEHMPYSSSFLT